MSDLLVRCESAVLAHLLMTHMEATTKKNAQHHISAGSRFRGRQRGNNRDKTVTHRARTERGSNGLNVILTFVTRPRSGTSVTERNARDAMLELV